ncbi:MULTISPECIES: UDP-2,3-diacylglucosamine diphosphatase [Zunongwangia]|uniref:Calcineurin-like phosphoesterase n=3 Tax=Flavobacteriaceae TaxID=49546 RepID=D5BFD5_ZUNPS|nr:UDP-2,3-diacylglucosamine diphosphatase [Zunongwangia profunda]ADF53033.1 calcineurin-like phosphoesterase [Zunongwangia profunda SM-A87]MAS72659.1 UDP-2,3-diacylglucosamine diphosphatase [Zunongwangia sp.]MCC4229714.1 UDP-2,3-diacylglucosamine diphosphatase [Zunongwangia profunda]HCV80364.1 UDP-2,3-diacylglucosamine diphosphatase [Zunongwangia profunda]
MVKKRKIDLLVISDVHLGTFGCHAKELLLYLDSVAPEKIILNGDFIDIWQFRKRYFPKSHLEVIKKIIDLSTSGTEIIYITGNHDEMLRKFSETFMGSFSIVDKLVLELDGKKAWFFHGDVFDVSIQNAKWIAKLGGWGYDFLILINRFLNWCLVRIGRKKYSLSKKIKNKVKGAIKFIDDFEKTATDLAIENGYKYVVCGHIHQPRIVRKTNKKGTCLYLNSGDWIENLTALEYNDKRWELIRFPELNMKQIKEPQLLTAITVLKRSKSR